MIDAGVLGSLKWRLIGPHRGGRVVAVAGHPTEKATFYFGACAGGVWKTTDGGDYWENISDGFFKTSAVGAIAVSESDPNVIYAGMGETAIRGNVSHGDGVYKSTDGGRTWKNVGLKDTRHIGDIAIHPQNPDLVYVAALGHAWGPNEERGVFRSTDGGENWEKVLHKSERAGCHDISMDPNNPRIIYAAIWQAQRYPHQLVSGGEDSSLWKTTDGGDTWTELTRNAGLPKGVLGKIGVAVSPAQADRVWALVEADDGALFRSDDGGDTWQRLSEDRDLRTRAWYYMHIYADPQDADTVWVLNMPCKKSIDGGKTFFDVPTPHGDNHDLWIDPQDPNRMIEGNDGGACVSFNGGITWSSIFNQPTAQFYHVTTDDKVPYNVYGSQQDNTALAVASMSFEGAITARDWFEPGGGESGYIAIKPTHPNTIFAGAIGSGLGHGRLIAYDPSSGQKRNITVWPEMHGMGEGVHAHRYRFQWTFPIELSPHNPDVLYVASNHVHRSTDEGTSWEEISPDLTRNDPEKLGPSGGPITRDNTGAEAYCTIFAFHESPHEQGVFWAGSDDGLVHISLDGGQNWENVTPPSLPEWALISVIEISPHSPSAAYVAATRYKHDDTRPYLFKTNDYGQTWIEINQGIPEDDFTRVIREDPERRGLLFAGTETGVYVSFDDGGSWQRLEGGGLPVVPIHDLTIKGHELVLATHGRSFWALDDLTPLRQAQVDLAGNALHLFQPKPTTRFRIYEGYGNSPTEDFVNFRMTGPLVYAYKQDDGTQEKLDAGENPPIGVLIHYYLKEKPEGELKLSILDYHGNEIRSYSSSSEEKGDPKPPAEAGANRFVWDLRYPASTPLKEEGEGDLFSAFLGSALSPRALPGEYQVRLTVGDQTLTEPFEIAPDPRLSVSKDDLQAQFDLKVQIRDKVSVVHETLNRLRSIRGQVDEWVGKTSSHESGGEVSELAIALKAKLQLIEDELIQLQTADPRSFPSRLKEKLASLAFMVDEADARPTKGSLEVFSQLSTRVDAQHDALQRVIDTDLAAFNQKIDSLGVAPVAP
jgi:photosystem II stability/assembly factor-like uncharacterized protein